MPLQVIMHHGSEQQKAAQEVPAGHYTFYDVKDDDERMASMIYVECNTLDDGAEITRIPADEIIYDKSGMRRQVPEKLKPTAMVEAGKSAFIELPLSRRAGQRVLEIRHVKRP